MAEIYEGFDTELIIYTLLEIGEDTLVYRVDEERWADDYVNFKTEFIRRMYEADDMDDMTFEEYYANACEAIFKSDPIDNMPPETAEYTYENGILKFNDKEFEVKTNRLTFNGLTFRKK